MKLTLALTALTALASTASAHWAIATQLSYTQSQHGGQLPPTSIGIIVDCPSGVNRDNFQYKKNCRQIAFTHEVDATAETTSNVWSDGYRVTANGSGRVIWRSDGRYIHCMAWSMQIYDLPFLTSRLFVNAEFLCTDTTFR